MLNFKGTISEQHCNNFPILWVVLHTTSKGLPPNNICKVGFKDLNDSIGKVVFFCCCIYLLLNILQPTEAKWFWIDTNPWHPSLPVLFTNHMKLLPDTISGWHDGCGSMTDVGFTDSSLSSPEGCQHSGWHSQTLPCGAMLGSWLCWAAMDAWTGRPWGQTASHTTAYLVKTMPFAPQ